MTIDIFRGFLSWFPVSGLPAFQYLHGQQEFQQSSAAQLDCFVAIQARSNKKLM